MQGEEQSRDFLVSQSEDGVDLCCFCHVYAVVLATPRSQGDGCRPEGLQDHKVRGPGEPGVNTVNTAHYDVDETQVAKSETTTGILPQVELLLTCADNQTRNYCLSLSGPPKQGRGRPSARQ
ncbi:hypothetical protein C0Q70_11942 [Pomacea canaliculata]|uniref:Uncharacterized protein n=1 Tax=Pomacea canaliculata TaxID=400727 RepID=A0A2T7P7D7_POMCA|nr:hypothetical protein C0Q70_11942 [Pomacea canaliculata]